VEKIKCSQNICVNCWLNFDKEVYLSIGTELFMRGQGGRGEREREREKRERIHEFTFQILESKKRVEKSQPYNE